MGSGYKFVNLVTALPLSSESGGNTLVEYIT